MTVDSPWKSYKVKANQIAVRLTHENIEQIATDMRSSGCVYVYVWEDRSKLEFADDIMGAQSYAGIGDWIIQAENDEDEFTCLSHKEFEKHFYL